MANNRSNLKRLMYEKAKQVDKMQRGDRLEGGAALTLEEIKQKYGEVLDYE